MTDTDSTVVKNIKDLCLKRIARAIFWNIVVQAVFINVYFFLINVDIFHPLKWFQQWFFCMFTFTTWLYFVPLTLVIAAQGVVCSRDYLNLQPFYRTRFSFYIHLITLNSMCIGFLHVFIGFLLPWIYLSLANDPLLNRFVYSCSNGFIDLECFSEERLYMILACVIVSAYYMLDNTFLGSQQLIFPIIHLPKLVQIKSQFLSMIKETIPYTVVPNLFFILFYCCFGGNLKHLITGTFSLYFNSSEPLDSLYNIFSIKRLFYLQFLTCITVSSMKLMQLFFKVYLTEHHVFPNCQSLVEGSQEILLKDALQCHKYPIVQHLAYLDLMKFSENNLQRRAEVYKLSIPGGHPHVWTTLKTECLSTIDGFVEELTPMLAAANKGLGKGSFIHKSRLPHDQPAHHLSSVMKKNVCQLISDNFVDWFTLKVRWINNLPIIIYFFGELKEMKIHYLLRKSLLVMWSAQSLSYLSCSSLTEDNYGIIQNDLNQIITSLLKLKTTLDSLEKYFFTMYKSPKELASYQQFIALRNSVKRSLYRIANGFKLYVTDLQLSKDVENKIMSFVYYKE